MCTPFPHHPHVVGTCLCFCGYVYWNVIALRGGKRASMAGFTWLHIMCVVVAANEVWKETWITTKRFDLVCHFSSRIDVLPTTGQVKRQKVHTPCWDILGLPACYCCDIRVNIGSLMEFTPPRYVFLSPQHLQKSTVLLSVGQPTLPFSPTSICLLVPPIICCSLICQWATY